MMRYLWNRDTRAARRRILRARFEAFKFGDEVAEPFLASLATVYGIVLLLPGETTKHALAWRVLRVLLHGDLGLGVVFTVFAVALWLTAFQLIPQRVRRLVLLATLSLWVGMAVGFAFGYLLSLGPWLSLLYAGLSWLAYTRVERERL